MELPFGSHSKNQASVQKCWPRRTQGRENHRKPGWGPSCEPWPKMALNGTPGPPLQCPYLQRLIKQIKTGVVALYNLHTLLPVFSRLHRHLSLPEVSCPVERMSTWMKSSPALPPGSSSDPWHVTLQRAQHRKVLPSSTHTSPFRPVLPLLRGLVGSASLSVPSSAFKRACGGPPPLIRAPWPASRSAI